MLDLHYVRDHLDEVAEAMRKRGLQLSFDRFQELDGARRELLVRVERLKKERNEKSRSIGQVVKSGGDARAARAEVREIGAEIARLESELESAESTRSH